LFGGHADDFLPLFFSLGFVAWIRLGVSARLGGLVLSVMLGAAQCQCLVASEVVELDFGFRIYNGSISSPLLESRVNTLWVVGGRREVPCSPPWVVLCVLQVITE